MVEPLAGTVFELLSVTDPGRTIPVAFSFQDLLDGFSEVLVPAVYSPREMNGVRDCVGANNARLQVSAAASDVALAPPGDYQALFRFRGRGTANRSLSEDFAVTLSILQLIRISGLDPIDLGTYAGVDDLRGGDDFCVFSNSPTGMYNLTVSGQGAGGDFIAESAGSRIPLMVEVDDGSGFVGAAPNAPALKNNAASNSLDCGGASNASIRVTARASDMQDLQGGVYSGELTLIVAPI